MKIMHGNVFNVEIFFNLSKDFNKRPRFIFLIILLNLSCALYFVVCHLA